MAQTIFLLTFNHLNQNTCQYKLVLCLWCTIYLHYDIPYLPFIAQRHTMWTALIMGWPCQNSVIDLRRKDQLRTRPQRHILSRAFMTIITLPTEPRNISMMVDKLDIQMDVWTCHLFPGHLYISYSFCGFTLTVIIFPLHSDS